MAEVQAQRVFTERSDQIPPRRRLTARLRAKLESAASLRAGALGRGRRVRVSEWSVHRALVVAAVARAAAPPPVRLGLDEIVYGHRPISESEIKREIERQAER